MMELQLALDFIAMPQAISMLEELDGCIDIVEVGTPLVIAEGLRAVREIRGHFPRLKILADLKIMDAGEQEAAAAIAAGADIVTVLGVSNDATIRGAVKAAGATGKEIMVDMIDVPDLSGRAQAIDTFGADYLCVHTAFDVQGTGENPLADLQTLKRVICNSKPAVAGGVNLSNIREISAQRPAIVVVGGGITGQPNKRETAEQIRRIMRAQEIE